MDVKGEVCKHLFLELVKAHKHVIFGSRSFKEKQNAWKTIHANLLSARLINANRDWKGIRQQWYTLTYHSKKSREQFLLGRIWDIPEFDKKVLTVSGIPITPIKEEISNAMDRLNVENDMKTEFIESPTRDYLEITENKFLSPVQVEIEKEAKSTEPTDKMEIDFLKRKLNEQKFKIQQCKLLKQRLEICNIKDKKEREAFMKLF